MAGQTLLWDSRLKTFVIMLPALGLMSWIASELASEEFIVPLAIMGLFAVLVLFNVFVQSIRFEAAVLCMLLVGYLVGNRGFADLSPAKPLYPGEVGLIAITACVLVRFALSRELPDFSGWIAKVIFLYLALGLLRLTMDFSAYHLDAIRDSAMVYYSVYYFFGRQLAARPETKRVLEKCLKFAFVALVPVALLERFLPDLNVLGGISAEGGYNLLAQKDDLMTSFAAAGVFIIYTRPHMFRWNWQRVLLIMFYLFLIVSGVGRASVLATAFASILILMAGRTRFFLYPMAVIAMGLTLFAGLVVSEGTSGGGTAEFMMDKARSMVDFTGSANYQSDIGAAKAGTNDYRRKLWATFIEETNDTSPVFGRGFGYNFVLDFAEQYRLQEAGGLRSAHNFYVTLYGRMGIIGILVFAALTLQIGFGGLQAALAVKAGRQPVADLGYWCSTWVILVSSAVGVVLEGPVGAIVFWAFLGVSSEVSAQALASARRELAERQPADLAPLPTLPPPQVAGYGRPRSMAIPSR